MAPIDAKPAPDSAIPLALERLAPLPVASALEEAAAHLRGIPSAALDGLPVAREDRPSPGCLDGRLLEALVARAQGGALGGVYTSGEEGRILAALALATAAARRGGPSPADGVALLLGDGRAAMRESLDGLVVLDPACGGGALLAAAWMLAASAGARLRLLGLDVAPLAVRAATLRLALLGAEPEVRHGDALEAHWSRCDLLLMNPPFLRHEALPPAWKARAVERTGLSRQADLSAHLVLLAMRHAPVCGLVLPRALDVSRSAAPLRAEASARGGYRVRLRSRAAGSFAASVETDLAVWEAGAPGAPPAEAAVPLPLLEPDELAQVAAGQDGARVRRVVPAPGRIESGRAGAGSRAPARRLGELCDVRFGLKSGANAFFHLEPLGGGRFRSPLAGEVELAPSDVAPLLVSMREVESPEVAHPARVLFRPLDPSPRALDHVRRGEELGVHRRSSCAVRRVWWRVLPVRDPAPVLYPTKIGARGFAFHNRSGLLEDKKWHALFPRELPAWAVALLLSASPIRAAVERGARQLTGAQAIADVDCGVLSAAPFPDPDAVAASEPTFAALWEALARSPVTTDLGAMLERPAQRELDLLVGALLGLDRDAVDAERRELVDRLAGRLDRARQVRRAMVGAGRGIRRTPSPPR